MGQGHTMRSKVISLPCVSGVSKFTLWTHLYFNIKGILKYICNMYHNMVCNVCHCICFPETGGLFGLAVRLMQLFSENQRFEP